MELVNTVVEDANLDAFGDMGSNEVTRFGGPSVGRLRIENFHSEWGVP